MPEKTQAKSLPPNIVAQILLAEAAGEGTEGLEFVADTMLNRARTQGKTLEDVATAPQQFLAFARPDLEDFYLRQPMNLRMLAEMLVSERRNPAFTPSHNAQHYVTTELWNRRNTLPKSHWLRNMEAGEPVGHHVPLRPRHPR